MTQESDHQAWRSPGLLQQPQVDVADCGVRSMGMRELHPDGRERCVIPLDTT